MDEIKKHSNVRIYVLGAIILAFIGLLWWCIPKLIVDAESDVKKYEVSGLQGDSFGSVNALFSGLAFAGVVIAIMLQMKELRLMREELDLARDELTRAAADQKEAHEHNKKLVKLQNEANFLAAKDQLMTQFELDRKDLESNFQFCLTFQDHNFLKIIGGKQHLYDARSQADELLKEMKTLNKKMKEYAKCFDEIEAYEEDQGV